VSELYLGTAVVTTVALVTQATAEVVYTSNPNVRTTQVAVEAVYAGTPKVRVAQAVVEVIYSRQSESLPQIYIVT
jgi:hypothetical protein